MFTGIVEKTGKIKKIEDKSGKVYFTIEVKNFLRGVKIGDSVACDGVCLTVIKIVGNKFTVELMPETLRLTRFSLSQAGDPVNLEKSLKVGGTIGGHFVMGHVDAVGEIKEISKKGADVNLTVKVPGKIMKYLAYKGSVSINGVSLTIGPSASLKTGSWFKVYLIGHTLSVTNLGVLKIGDQVNIEVDTIARYLEKLL